MYYTVFIIQQKFLLNIMFLVFVNNEVSGSGHEVKVKVTQSGPALWDLVDCSLPGSSVLGILQARMLNWAAHSLLQRIFLTQRSNPGLPHCKWILYHLSHQGIPRILEWEAYTFSRESSDPGIKPGSPVL